MGYLNDLAEDLYENAKAKGFHDDAPAYQLGAMKTDALATYERVYNGNRLMLIAGEISEAHEELRAGHEVNEIYYAKGRTKPEGVPIELGDVLIRTLETMYAWGIDPDEVVRIKQNYNAGRPFKHGKTM
jgi:hypothetical protein